MKSLGYTLDLLTVNEARALEPELSPGLLGAVHFPLRAQADPVKATTAFAAAARQQGANVLTGREVTAIARQADGAFRVTCKGEEHTAKSLVLAAGAWCAPLGEMLGLGIPIIPVRGQMWASQPLPPRVFCSLSAAESPRHWSTGPGNDPVTPPELTHIGPRRVTRHLYGRQTRDGELVFGGDRQLAGYDKTVDQSGIEVNFGHVRELLPMLGQLSIARTWAGLMPFSLDGRPVIGAIPQVEDLYIVSGLASSGFGRGPIGRQTHCRLHPHRPPAPCPGRVGPGPVRFLVGLTASCCAQEECQRPLHKVETAAYRPYSLPFPHLQCRIITRKSDYQGGSHAHPPNCTRTGKYRKPGPGGRRIGLRLRSGRGSPVVERGPVPGSSAEVRGSRRWKWADGEGITLVQEPTNNGNGLTRDPQGRLVMCEMGARRVSRVEPDGSITVIAGSYHGRPLNRPNDVVVKSDGSIYFTDPGGPAPDTDLDFSGVYRVSPDLSKNQPAGAGLRPAQRPGLFPG